MKKYSVIFQSNGIGIIARYDYNNKQTAKKMYEHLKVLPRETLNQEVFSDPYSKRKIDYILLQDNTSNSVQEIIKVI